MKRLTNLPIRWRLSLLFGGILLLVLTAFGGGVYVYFKNSLQRSIDTKIRSIAEVISSSITDTHDPTVFGNFERYLENVLGRKPKGKFIQIMDRSGRIGAKMSDIETQTLPTSFSTLERATQGETVYETIETGTPRLRMITFPIIENKKVTSIVQVGTSLEDFDETMKRLLIILLIGIPSSIVAAIAVGYYMAKKALKPVDQIRRAAIKISSSNLDERIDVGRRKDELSRLAHTFNEMIARLKDAFQRINQFSIDVSHELKTPLTILKGETEVALRKPRDNGVYQQLLTSNLEEINQMARIIDDLLLLAKADTGETQLKVNEVDLKDLILEVYSGMSILAEKKNIELTVEELHETRLPGDELKLRRMLWNVVENGIKYTQPGGRVAISSRPENGSIRINVKDTGVGISEKDLKYVFDRFYRAGGSRNRESGSGLGLSISKWIAEAHKGTIEVESHASSGTIFSIKLPLAGGAT
ncbi:MAG TPA: heavy metal sensor histidine kinase [Syntrophorhabdales bacterium]|nr:heavy metal sensor histidine kinase [Syntrophorhabdales bacterium]